ncbi:hypothetical protein ACHQM5_014388 [Ranunculus cassubicifolius]
MQKIALHIKNPAKFSKASKLALQLIQGGSVKPGTSNHFFEILETAMSSTTCFTTPSLRADYHALFTAAQDLSEFLSKKQKNQLTSWSIKAVLGNDLYTDDSFVFSKAATRVKEIISNFPVSEKDDDVEEAETEAVNNEDVVPSEEEPELDPFGLDALLSGPTKAKKDVQEDESKRFLKSQREAILYCLEISARRYKLPWCQTVVDILVKHAFDHIDRFTAQQRQAIEKLWVSIREQQTRRRQGKSVSGKLDMNGFELLQQKYANEKISIRKSVGGGTRRAETWLG